MKKKRITREQVTLIFSGITAIFILIIPSLLKTVPDIASGNYTATLVRENINMAVAYILLALIPFVIAGWVWAFKRAGEKPNVDKKVEQLEKKMNERFDAVDKNLEVLKEGKDDGTSKHDAV